MLWLNIIGHDMAAGYGFAVLDPHGDLTHTVPLRAPRNRRNVIMLANAPVTSVG